MRLRCAQCGRSERVGFRVWWYYFWKITQPILHLQCAFDMEDQRRLDGLD